MQQRIGVCNVWRNKARLAQFTQGGANLTYRAVETHLKNLGFKTKLKT